MEPGGFYTLDSHIPRTTHGRTCETTILDIREAPSIGPYTTRRSYGQDRRENILLDAVAERTHPLRCPALAHHPLPVPRSGWKKSTVQGSFWEISEAERHVRSSRVDQTLGLRSRILNQPILENLPSARHPLWFGKQSESR